MYPTTITQKGQVTIPVAIRQMVNFKPRQKVTVTVQDNAVMIKPAVDFFGLRGSIKTKKKYSKAAVNKAIGQYFIERHKRKMRYG